MRMDPCSNSYTDPAHPVYLPRNSLIFRRGIRYRLRGRNQIHFRPTSAQRRHGQRDDLARPLTAHRGRSRGLSSARIKPDRLERRSSTFVPIQMVTRRRRRHDLDLA